MWCLHTTDAYNLDMVTVSIFDNIELLHKKLREIIIAEKLRNFSDILPPSSFEDWKKYTGKYADEKDFQDYQFTCDESKLDEIRKQIIREGKYKKLIDQIMSGKEFDTGGFYVFVQKISINDSSNIPSAIFDTDPE
jgi:hypothetical protein